MARLITFVLPVPVANLNAYFGHRSCLGFTPKRRCFRDSRPLNSATKPDNVAIRADFVSVDQCLDRLALTEVISERHLHAGVTSIR